MNPLFKLESVSCQRGAQQALSNVSLRFVAGEFVALCGLNGAGKSTLLEVMMGLVAQSAGRCAFEGRDIRKWPARELARKVSFLPQSTVFSAGFTSGEVVRMGRYPFGGGWIESEEDARIIRDAMRLSECEQFESRPIHQLSGGERQRVLFAAALAQQPIALLLDEPGAFVDLPHQIKMFRTLRDLCRGGLLCVAATHDLNLAAAFATRLVLLDAGRLVADGAPVEVLPGGPFKKAFGEHVRVEVTAAGTARVHYAV